MNTVKLKCDVLIAGGGMGGLSCAVALKERRPELDILIVEKQTAGYGGKANKGGGVLQYFNPDVKPMDFLAFHTNAVGCFLGDQEMMLRYVEMNHEMLDVLSSWGVNVPKNDDGSYNVVPTGPLTSMIFVDLDITLSIRKRAEKLGVKIMDKTTIAELFTDNGKITGAAAYSILDGEFYAISAGRVVLATGSQNYRLASMWSSGRGDGIAAAYRAGAEMRNAEFGNFAQLVKVKSHNEIVFGENYMYNAKGEFITANFRPFRETDINSTAIREWYLQMTNGAGPVHLDYGEEAAGEDAMEKQWVRPYGQKFRTLNTLSANEVDKDLEVCPLFIGEQSPIKVGHDMQSTVSGLYAIGDCSYCGSAAPGAVPAPPGRNRGSGILNALFAALVCAEAMADSPSPAPTELSPAAVEECREEIFAPLSRKGGHRAKEVIALIQQAMAPAELSVYMSAERMDKAEKIIEKAEEYSRELSALDFHDLLACHEAEAMVLSAKMHYAAARLRTESRGWFLREDYPETDNDNWLKWIIIKNENGKMTFSTENVPIEKYPIQIQK